MDLLGMVRPMTAFPRSRLPLPAPNGMALASLVSGTRKTVQSRRLGHEAGLDQTCPLRHLHPGLYRARARSGVQFAGCPTRCGLGQCKESGPCRWTLIRSRYDDGGYSGGSTDRPDLQKLLDDIPARKIDVLVVYKVDRLTRSLADFAKLVEIVRCPGCLVCLCHAAVQFHVLHGPADA